MKLSEAIKFYRKKTSLYQQDFATKLHTSIATVSAWENGNAAPSRMSRAALRRLDPELWDNLMTRVDSVGL